MGRSSPPKQRFWEKVDKSSGPTGCWVWMGAKMGIGYGEVQLNWEKHPAHRFAWLITYGAVPIELKVLHKCDNPPCVNPNHLFLGTSKDNTADMLAKGRNDNGGGSKLTDREAGEICKLYKPRVVTLSMLADRYGVSWVAIWKIVHGKAHKNG